MIHQRPSGPPRRPITIASRRPIMHLLCECADPAPHYYEFNHGFIEIYLQTCEWPRYCDARARAGVCVNTINAIKYYRSVGVRALAR